MDISAFGPALLMVQRRSGRSCVPAGGRSIRWRRWLWREKPFQTPPTSCQQQLCFLSCCLSSTQETFWWCFTFTMSAFFAVDFCSESRIPKFVFLCSRFVIWIMINEWPCCVSWTYKIAWKHYNPRLLGLFPKYYKVVKGDTQCEDDLYRWNTGIEFLARKRCVTFTHLFFYSILRLNTVYHKSAGSDTSLVNILLMSSQKSREECRWWDVNACGKMFTHTSPPTFPYDLGFIVVNPQIGYFP